MSGGKRGRGFVRWGVLLLVIGFVLGVVGVVGVIAKAGSGLRADFRSPVATTPASVIRHLDPGTYVVYEETGTRKRFGPVTTNQDAFVTLTPDQVTVTDPAGEALQLDQPDISETLTRGDRTFTGAVQFHVHDSGVYRVNVSAPGLRIIVAPSLTSTIRQSLAWFGAIAGGVVLGATGFVLLVIGLVRGRKPQVAAAPLPAGGWFPDPSRQARLRWWDGHQWTDHTS